MRRTAAASNQASGFREAFTRIFGDPPTAAKNARLAGRANRHAVGNRCSPSRMIKVCVCSSSPIDAHWSASIPILRQRLRTNVVSPESIRSWKDPRATCRVFLGQEFGVRSSARSSRIGFSTPRVENPAINSRWRNALLFLDGGEVENSWRAPCRRSRQRHKHALHRHSMSSCYSRGWHTLCGYGGGLWRKKWLLEHERKWNRRDASTR